MRDYVIITDSCVDLPEKLAQELNLIVLPLKVTVEGKEYQNFLDEREIKIKDFYAILREHKKTSTAQAIPAEFIEIMTPFLKENKDILSISFSSSLSGTYNSAQIASKDLLKEFPGAVIECVDSLSASMGQGLLLTYAARLKQNGASLEEVKQFVLDTRLQLSHLFTVSDLGHLRRGGRLSAGMEILGTLLNVKPLLHVSKEGKLVVYEKARGRFKSLHSLVNRMVDTFDKSKDQLVYISHGDSLEDAEFVKSLILEKLPVKEKNILVNPIGPVIGSHSGVDTIAIFYLGNERTK
ncbi:MAG: DegV family protein [Candidatus Izemoplasmatales bacterium]|jgi:DegV family protein with EDD domain|nr:DegV family protein [Candidatus Izemoplasmatales bacterium]